MWQQALQKDLEMKNFKTWQQQQQQQWRNQFADNFVKKCQFLLKGNDAILFFSQSFKFF